MTHVTTQPSGPINTANALTVCSRTKDDVSQALRTSPYQSLRKLECDYFEGVLTLRGHVGSFFMKQLAQTVASRVAGVDIVVNRLDVFDADSAQRTN